MRVSLLNRIKTRLATGYAIDPIVYAWDGCVKYKDIYLDILYDKETGVYSVAWHRELPPGVLAREVQYATSNPLDKLIHDCGYGFRSLSLHSDGRWLAKSGANTGKYLTSSRLSPQDAVRKLKDKLTTREDK